MEGWMKVAKWALYISIISLWVLIKETQQIEVSWIPNERGASMPQSARYRETLKELCTAFQRSQRYPKSLSRIQRQNLDRFCSQLSANPSSTNPLSINMQDLKDGFNMVLGYIYINPIYIGVTFLVFLCCVYAYQQPQDPTFLWRYAKSEADDQPESSPLSKKEWREKQRHDQRKKRLAFYEQHKKLKKGRGWKKW